MLVKRTVQFRLDGSGSDITSEGVSGLFGSLLCQPAPSERVRCAELPDDRLLAPEPADLRKARDVLARIVFLRN